MSLLLPRPSLIAIDAISNVLTAQQCGTGNNLDGHNVDVARSGSQTPP